MGLTVLRGKCICQKKHIKVGFKIWCCSCTCCGYACIFQVYDGKPYDPVTEKGLVNRDRVAPFNEVPGIILVGISVKGKPNLTKGQICQWVNDNLLPNETLEPKKKKGMYVDGHEHVEYRKTFLRKMVSLVFLVALSLRRRRKLFQTIPMVPHVMLLDGESTFQANEDQLTLRAEKGTTVMKQTSNGAEIMVSDFIAKHNGYLQLMDEDNAHAKRRIRRYVSMHDNYSNMVRLTKVTGHLKCLWLTSTKR